MKDLVETLPPVTDTSMINRMSSTMMEGVEPNTAWVNKNEILLTSSAEKDNIPVSQSLIKEVDIGKKRSLRRSRIGQL